MLPFMTEEEMTERFGELQDQIDAYKTQIEELKEALQIVIRFSHPNAVTQARQYAQGRGSQSPWMNPPPDEPGVREKCEKFVAKYSEFEAKP